MRVLSKVSLTESSARYDLINDSVAARVLDDAAGGDSSDDAGCASDAAAAAAAAGSDMSGMMTRLLIG